MLTKIINFLKRPRNSILTGIAAAIVLIFGILIINRPGSAFQTADAKIAAIQQEVSVTGRIKPAKKVDLSFEAPGRISGVAVRVGQNVFAGQFLMSLDLSELTAQKLNVQAGVNVAKARLDQLRSGARREDVAVFQTNLESSKENLINSTRTGLNAAKDSMIALTDAQYAYFADNSADSNRVADAKEAVLQRIYGQLFLGRIATFYFSQLSDILTSRINKTEEEGNYSEILAISEEIGRVLSESKYALDVIYETMENSPVKTNIGAEKSNILGQISMLTSAQNSFKSSQNQLNLKTAPASQFDIQVAESQLDQAKANLAAVQAQINKKVIIAPISGVIAEINGEIGELSNSAEPAISLISGTKYEAEAQIPEADIVKTKVGDGAKISVDAYGSDVFWSAKVIKIYPAEKMIDGVATYKAVLLFDENDSRIRPGMTANIDIIGDKKDEALVVPQRSIIRKNGSKFVKVLVEKNSESIKQFASFKNIFEDKKQVVYEIPVETGIKGADGKIEIISGLKAGDKVVIE